jgi:hypothetical protein
MPVKLTVAGSRPQEADEHRAALPAAAPMATVSATTPASSQNGPATVRNLVHSAFRAAAAARSARPAG